MAHQAHAIPWNSFASNFEYTIRSHITKRPELYLTKHQNHLKDFHHFSKALSNQIRDFGRSERAKYASVGEFKNRAESWVESNMVPDLPESGEPITSERIEKSKGWETGKKSVESKKAETRKVYSDAFRTKYTTEYDDWAPYRIGLHQNIASWLSTTDANPCIDTIKMLMMTAANATFPLSSRPSSSAIQHHDLETLLLFIHHPYIDMKYWRHQGDYSTRYGIEAVAEKALDGYLMLNLFYAMRENESRICERENGYQGQRGFGCMASRRLAQRDIETLRPAYMNTSTWENVVEYLVSSNRYNSEQLMHRSFFFPDWNEANVENAAMKDVMVDIQELTEYLKGLWRVLVVYEVFWREMGVVVLWEELTAYRLWLQFPTQMVLNKDKGMYFYEGG
ncbi:hypothetical protein B0O99DRAFT_246905 [Bisporella sp. PMI_857]|nr:hypothetical protein B0O99DRAFT_246905 [Bisporella sp. PMI_857]